VRVGPVHTVGGRKSEGLLADIDGRLRRTEPVGAAFTRCTASLRIHLAALCRPDNICEHGLYYRVQVAIKLPPIVCPYRNEGDLPNMKRSLFSSALLATLAVSAIAGSAAPAAADPYDHHRDARAYDRGRHDWHRGDRMELGDWRRYERVDYRAYHLRAPPYGYEWRRVNGNFVLAAMATGLITDVLIAPR
jgi:Ni/Co efflux regulator RcnB